MIRRSVFRGFWTFGIAFSVVALFISNTSYAKLKKLPAMFTNHAVLQHDMPLPVWGWADPGDEVTVEIEGGQSKTTKADDQGKWRVTLDPLKVGKPLTLVVTGGKEETGKSQMAITDVLVGEVWLCSGQSNMEFRVDRAANGDLDILSANHPDIRLINVKGPGSQKPVEDFTGHWDVCSPESVKDFSAVGYYFGRELHEQLNVPIGLIDDSWGGSSCEAWIRRDRMEGKPLYTELLKKWDDSVKNWNEADWKAKSAEWKKKAERAKAAGKAAPRNRPLESPPALGQHRPANLYHARVEPVMPYAIRGAIWYQGESNAPRAYQYRDMFPLMIASWRDDWKEGDFPFYWVQLADFKNEQSNPSESDWAELREAQTMTQDKLKNTGEAVIIDIGDAHDIHPRKKLEVGRRLARWALAHDYGKNVVCQSPRYDSMKKQGNKIMVKFKDVAGDLNTIDSPTLQGFAIAGADRKWVWADAKIVEPAAGAKRDTVEVSSKEVADPVAVRYAWADNPVCNLYNDAPLLPATPFRTDDWPGITAKILK